MHWVEWVGGLVGWVDEKRMDGWMGWWMDWWDGWVGWMERQTDLVYSIGGGQQAAGALLGAVGYAPCYVLLLLLFTIVVGRDVG